MMTRKGFLISLDLAEVMKDMPKELAGDLIQLICEYELSEHEKMPNLDEYDQYVKSMFIFFKRYLDENYEKYNKKCEQNKMNIEKRWNDIKKADSIVDDQQNNDTTVYDGIPKNTTVYDRIDSNEIVYDRIEPYTKLYECIQIKNKIKIKIKIKSKIKNKIKNKKIKLINNNIYISSINTMLLSKAKNDTSVNILYNNNKIKTISKDNNSNNFTTKDNNELITYFREQFGRDLYSYEINEVSQWENTPEVKQAIKKAVKYGAYNINYIKTIIKNQNIQKNEKVKQLYTEEPLPDWFGKTIIKTECSDNERQEIEDLLKEYK